MIIYAIAFSFIVLDFATGIIKALALKTYSSTAANKPGNNGGIVFAVRASANYIHQLAFMNYPQAVDADVVYYRRCYAGSWTGWRNVSMS